MCIPGPTPPIDNPTGAISASTGDLADIKKAFKPLYDRLDHCLLNELEGIGNPTAESLARWIWPRLKPALPGLTRLEVRETPTSGCVYRGD